MSTERFVTRHVGPRDSEIDEMLKAVGVKTLDELIDQTVPKGIRMAGPLNLPAPLTEQEYLAKIKGFASQNKIFSSFIGMGYYGTHTPSVILRNIFENPGWYTSYTPYQAEISQGRLEALLNFQTAVMDLTGMEMANASLLDEATAAAEAMLMMHSLRSRKAVKEGRNILFVDSDVFPQNLEVICTRAEPLDIEIVTGCYSEYKFTGKEFGVIVQYPSAKGNIRDYSAFAAKAKENDALVTVIADILSLALLTPPGEWDTDIVVGSTQRFGIPMGFGGPHAGYFATKEKYKRNLPGRIIGVSVDRHGNKALRMALQTREQHIKRERATSNICTAQALLATMAGMYAVYHGPEGIKRVATHTHSAAIAIANGLTQLGYKQNVKNIFDTLEIELPANVKIEDIRSKALAKEINFNYKTNGTIGISTDELTTLSNINNIIEIFAEAAGKSAAKIDTIEVTNTIPENLKRKSEYLTDKVFNVFHSETEMMRYIKRLERKDIALNHSMISLGSCTMKLNAATEMLPLSWVEFGNIHPFVPAEQAKGYLTLISELEQLLAEITGFDAVSMQPNSGAAGEYAGLMVIREYHKSRGEGHRNIALIPSSAHGTNPASAVMAGLDIVIVDCDEDGNISIDDLRAKAEEHKDNLAAFIVTYPSTHGVFEPEIIEMMKITHNNGGQVYMDGANMNAQVGLTSPGLIGADVCHLNLHKTFAIPHGGGGPGVGPIGVAKHLSQFLPSHPVVKTGGENGITAVAGAPWGSAMVQPITYGYILMLGAEGLKKSTEMAILGANYITEKLKGYYDVVYTGKTGRVAHEMILDCRHFKQTYGVETGDIARRLMDYGFHAPTLSFPVNETLMVEPTESESVQELDRFIEAMISIKKELDEIKEGKADKEDNVLKNAPHTVAEVAANEWTHAYDREKAAYPLPWLIINKFWPSVSKIDSAYGDRNLVCSCAPIEDYL
ncbi:MAG TPA: aminomethyl-transferring glycine dehydrogenase [Perlabentimonas sp.]|nr:aminomethyl-transferring glycine dehydrogenase [Bacteroidales bacterium]MDD4672889.1 aminomethyl-transferring glycine dehydrogenase [Bacteroidales bacterium]MDY0348723.1 aminomethyl-transferring glycine dehydrogenase [Tenuifilaceae bacterium]HZJ73662.1 aminomethyl-transferring glycine dehydrogenase [Perlabentimonas sp.]